MNCDSDDLKDLRVGIYSSVPPPQAGGRHGCYIKQE